MEDQGPAGGFPQMPSFDGKVPPEYDPSAMAKEYLDARENFDPVFYLIGLALFLLFFCLFNKDKKVGQDAEKKSPEVKGEGDPKKTFFTREELRKNYDGKGPTGKTYVGLFDQVFDVSSSPFYSEGGDYAAFAGRDITVACAHHSTEEKYLSIPYDRDTSELTFDQEQNIMMFFTTFCQKYRIVGKLQGDKKDQ